jgi:hypothetical protein
MAYRIEEDDTIGRIDALIPNGPELTPEQLEELRELDSTPGGSF